MVSQWNSISLGLVYLGRFVFLVYSARANSVEWQIYFCIVSGHRSLTTENHRACSISPVPLEPQELKPNLSGNC